jgi:hypothetical protein
VLLAACGGSGGKSAGSASSGPQAKLEKALGASAASLRSATLSGDIRLDPEGLLKLGGPIAVHVGGPFAASNRTTAPRFDLAFLATLGGEKFKGGVLSTGSRSYLRLDDRAYALGARHSGGTSGGKPHPGLRALGIDPLPWIRNVSDKGREQVAGVPTDHLAGDVDAPRLLADVGTLLSKVGGGAGSFIAPKLLQDIAGAVSSAKVDLWTGARDSLVRQIAVDVRFAFKPAQSPIVGLDGGHLTLRLRLDDVNGAPVKVRAPAAVRPVSEVTGKGGFANVLGGLGAGLTGGIDGGAIELVSCVTGSGGSSVELFGCVAKLAP